MPELAEVETLMHYLKKNVLNEKIVSFQKNRNNLRYRLASNLKELVENSFIIDVKRRAKFLNIKLSNHNSIVVHLGMCGRLSLQSIDYNPVKHDHVQIRFMSGYQLVFNDTRRFGMMYACKSSAFSREPFLRNMGVEPFSSHFNGLYLENKLKNRTLSIKNAIMDSTIVVGIGNIYASEILFDAKISPYRIVKQIEYKEILILVRSIRSVLLKAIKCGGTTLKDFLNGDGKPGYFKQELNVYGRYGMECYICRNIINKTRQLGRSSFFCPQCQV